MKTEKMTQPEAYKKREELLNWFSLDTFGECSDIEQIVVTRDTVEDFRQNNPTNTIIYRDEESPCGYEVYGGFGLLIVDGGDFRFVFVS
jgi:hypothetical protein